MSDEAFDTVRDFLTRRTGVRAAKVTPEARLVEDLGIDGDDLVEAMDAFFTETGVEVGDYRHDDHAPAEGFSLFGKRRDHRPLPVSALVAALRAGRWGGSTA